MGSRYDVEVTIRSAGNLKNVNWRHGDLRPYAVAWIDPSAKSSTKVNIDHNTDPEWDEKITIPLPHNISLRDANLYVDVVHANADEGSKHLVGSARLPLSEVIDEVGIGGKVDRSLKLKRPSGRPHGKLDLRVSIKETHKNYDPYAQPPPSFGQTYESWDLQDPYAAPPAGSPYSGPPLPQCQYGGYQPAYGEVASGSTLGLGSGLAVGDAAGVPWAYALGDPVNRLEDKVEDDVAERGGG